MIQKTEKLIDSMVAVKNSDSSDVMGYLTWYSVGEDLYYREDLRKALLANGIEEKYLPKPIRAHDAYRRATKAIETKRYRDEETEKEYKNYIIRDVVTTGDRLQRNIVIERVNQGGERLDYDTEGAKMYFDKPNNQFTFIANEEHAEELAEEAQKLFKVYTTAHNGATVRSSVVQFMNTLAPTPVRPSGGVYFVPIKYASQLRNLVSFVSSFKKGEAYMIPLLNDDENKLMVRDKVKEHLDKITNQCRAILASDGEVKEKRAYVNSLIEEANRSVRQFKDYKELLSDQVNELDGSVDLVRNLVDAVLRKVSN